MNDKKGPKMAKVVLSVAACTLIIISSIGLLGLIAGFMVLAGKSTEEIIKLIGNEPRFPKLIYFGAISGLITAPIYIVAGINLLRLRFWARKLLLWFIPVMLVIDIIYLFLVDMLNKSTSTTLIIEFIIWIILLNKTIENQFKKS